MTLPAHAQSLLSKYKNRPEWKGLIELGFGAASLALLPDIGPMAGISIQYFNGIMAQRVTEFFETVVDHGATVEEEVLKSEAFAHCFVATTKRAMHTFRSEKIQMFARLLKAPISGEGRPPNVDEYDYFLTILDDLTYREIQALEILYRYTDTPRAPDQNDPQWTRSFWEDFVLEVSNELEIPEEEVGDFLIRISRTACFHEYKGYWDTTHGMGKVSPTYERLRQYVIETGDQSIQ